MSERQILGTKHHGQRQEADSCRDSGLGGTVACSETLTGVLAADADANANADTGGGSAAGVGFGQGWRFHGGATAGRSDGGRGGSGRPRDEARDGGIVGGLSAAAAAVAGGPAAADAERGRDPLELGAAASLLEGEEVDGEEARRRWRWQRGLRRMVDRDSPSVSNKQSRGSYGRGCSLCVCSSGGGQSCP